MKKYLSLLTAAVMILSLFSVIPFGASAAWDGTSSAEFAGEGTAASPYLIASPENLRSLQEQVAAGNDFEGEYFTQTADIDLGNKEWTPIGTSSTPFCGVYDGLGHKITGLSITQESNAMGLFGYIESTWTSEAGIMNLDVTGEFVFEQLTGNPGLGGVVGWVYKDSEQGYKRCQIINVTGNVNITVKSATNQPRMGAVLGYCFEGDVTNVVNNGAIVYTGSANSRVGGVVGQSNRSTYTGCVNNGSISVNMTGTVTAHVGGICSMTTYKTIDVYTVYDNCVNNGAITVETEDGKIYLGGITGATYSSGKPLYLEVKNCLNTGAISGKVKSETGKNIFIGGISAYSENTYTSVVDCVNNTTDVTGETKATGCVGGIVGKITAADETMFIKDCLSLSETISGEQAATETGCEVSALAAQLGPKIDAINARLGKVEGAVINGFPGSPEQTTEEVTTVAEPEPTTPEQTTAAAEPETTTAGKIETAEVTTAAAPEPKKGCGSMTVSLFAVAAVVGTAAVIVKKHD
ncbi:MAG: hypothetical protein ILO42_04890 [Clostridia bacterium]|nr:hypothetical protein [Clostridia bacterium]